MAIIRENESLFEDEQGASTRTICVSDDLVARPTTSSFRNPYRPTSKLATCLYAGPRSRPTTGSDKRKRTSHSNDK